MGRGSRWAVIRLNSAGIILKWKVQRKHQVPYFQAPESRRELCCATAGVQPPHPIPSSAGTAEPPTCTAEASLALLGPAWPRPTRPSGKDGAQPRTGPPVLPRRISQRPRPRSDTQRSLPSPAPSLLPPQRLAARIRTHFK